MTVSSVPYDLYLRFLYTKGIFEFAAIKNELKRLSLPPITYEMYEVQGTYVNKNVPPITLHQMEKKRHDLDFIYWMGEIDVRELWYGEPSFLDDNNERDVRLTLDIHNDPIFRLTLNGLLIKGVDTGDLSPMLNIKFSTGYKPKHLELYRKFFFDPRRMKRGDWKKFLDTCDDNEKNIYFSALTESLDGLKSKLGLPSRVSASEELAKLLRQSIDKANQYLSLGSKETNHEARAWIDTTLKLTEKYEKYRTADSSDFGKALQMEFEYVETGFDTPDAGTLNRINEERRKKEERRAEEELFPDEA